MPIIGKTLEGRQFKTDGSNSNQKPIEIEATTGDETTANSATPFLKFTGSEVAGVSNGEGNISGTNIPSGFSKGVLVEVNGTQYWMPVYALS